MRYIYALQARNYSSALWVILAFNHDRNALQALLEAARHNYAEARIVEWE